MERFSLEPDESMKWIYDPSHRDYNTPQAHALRDRRGCALGSCPQWMFWDAFWNDELHKQVPNAKVGEGENGK